jgi:signal transduction histidine kinase
MPLPHSQMNVRLPLSLRGAPGLCLILGFLGTLIALVIAYRFHQEETGKALERAALHHWEALELVIEKHEMALTALADVVRSVPPEDGAGMVAAMNTKAQRMALQQDFPGWVVLGLARSYCGPVPSRDRRELFASSNAPALEFEVLGCLRMVPMKSLTGRSVGRNQRLGIIQAAIVDNRPRTTKPMWLTADPAAGSEWQELSRQTPLPERLPTTEQLTNPVIHVRFFVAAHRGDYVEESGTNRPMVVVFGSLVLDHLEARVSEVLDDGIRLSIHDQLPARVVRKEDIDKAVPIRWSRTESGESAVEFAVMRGNHWLPNGPPSREMPEAGSGPVVRLKRRQYFRDWLIEGRPTAAFRHGGSWTLVIATGCIGTMLTCGVTAAMAVESRRRREAEELSRLLMRAGRELKQSDAERQEIVQQLHDQSAQTLAGVSMLLQRSLRDLEMPDAGSPPDHRIANTRERLGAVMEGLEEVALELRQHMSSMEVLPMEPATWWDSLKKWLERYQRATECRFDLHADEGLFESLRQEDRTLLASAVRELASNAVRHGRATRVGIHLSLDSGIWSLVVRDDGTGFDATRATAGRGLQHLRERVRALEGSLHSESGSPSGSRVLLRWPTARERTPRRH